MPIPNDPITIEQDDLSPDFQKFFQEFYAATIALLAALDSKAEEGDMHFADAELRWTLHLALDEYHRKKGSADAHSQ